MKPTRLECVQGTSRKFWEVSTKGVDLVIRFGRLGTDGQTKTKTFDGRMQAEAAAAALIRKKIQSGYELVGAGSGATSSKKSLTASGKKPRGAAEEKVAAAVVAWVRAAARHMRAPQPELRSLTYGKGVVSATTREGKRVRGKVSAPVSLLAGVWRHEPKLLEKVCLEPPGRWNDVVTLVRCEGAAHDRYMDLVAAVHAAGHEQEARLAWLQAKFIDDPDDRADPLFAELFAKLPAAFTKAKARSSAALLRVLPHAKSRSSVDALIVAVELYNFMDDAFDDVVSAGKRERELFGKIEDAIAALARSDELAVRDMARLNRQQFARAVAFAVDEPG